MADNDSSEVLRKIGRNIVNFQKLEGLLKELASAPNYNGSLEEVKEQKNKHFTSLRKMSFGMVVRDFFDSVYPRRSSDTGESDPSSYEFSIKIKGGDRDRLVAAIKKIVDARNDLIHHRLTGFHPESDKDREELSAYLDSQHEHLIPIYREIVDLVIVLRAARSEMLNQFEAELAENDEDNSADA